MEITKLLTSYKVKETSTTLLFEGEAQFNGDGVIQSLSGVIKTIEESPLSAYAHYSFNGGTSNQNISNLDEKYGVEAATLIDTIIKTIKTSIV